ncbi:glycosyltransferase family 2 protein [Telluribacter sp.]|jgi:glycosyltransferase involved in cell wall biosynthesis|uniref:glycosyltransferase family 2 protein n=1 Tax=Telluribacter sp. TaxID=1978767 RepID=UPI002E13DDB3|nr:glycosyltransferase [Telluribacter sp.]
MITKIQKQREVAEAKFSILIPTWNNLPYLKLCVESIRRNSTFQHQLIIHINEGKDGTLDWVQQQHDLSYTHSSMNVGVCYALNSSALLATTSYIVYINDDMYVCPGWDEALLQEIQKIGHPYFFLSATAIERTPQSVCSLYGDYGSSPDEFDEERLLKEYSTLPMQDWQGATWPPNVVHKDLWHLVGGYSIEFSPGMYSDPDFSMKLWLAGVRLFKGVSRSRAYHFGSVSLKRVKRNKGYYTFIRKWRMTSSTLSRYYLRQGNNFDGVLEQVPIPASIQLKNLFRRLESLLRSN